MPRITKERWVNVQYGVDLEQVQVHTPQGLPEFDPDGQPVTTRNTTLVFIHPDENLRVDIPFGDDALTTLISKLVENMDHDQRRNLITALSGGIVIPNARLN